MDITTVENESLITKLFQLVRISGEREALGKEVDLELEQNIEVCKNEVLRRLGSPSPVKLTPERGTDPYFDAVMDLAAKKLADSTEVGSDAQQKDVVE